MNARARWVLLCALPLQVAAAQPHAARDDCVPAAGAGETMSDHGLAYEVVGCGSPVVVLHGFSADRGMWRDLVPQWQRAHTLVLVDLPSHGRSAMAHAGDDVVLSLLALLDALGLPRASIIGHSAGAALAVDFAARFPRRVASVVLLSPSVTGFRATARVDLSEVAARVRAHDPAGAAEAWLAAPVMRVHLDAPGVAWFGAMIRTNTRVWQLDQSRPAPPTMSADARIAALHMPLFVGLGADDPAGTAEVVRAIRTAHPGAELREFAGRGHWFPIESPREVASLVAAFLRRHHQQP